jgi:HEAT repeat protein
MVKNGDIGRLEVVNISIYPAIAAEVGTRSVPWMRIGRYELSGNYTTGELRSWVEKAASGNTDSEYLRELLEQQQLDQAIEYIRSDASHLPQLLELMQDEEGSLSVKFGIGAIFEALEGSEALVQAIPDLGKLTGHEKANLRGDAAYYLGLSHDQSAKPWLQPLLQDTWQDVREIAGESLDMLEEST